MSRDEFTTRALDEGRIDEAIRHLLAQTGDAQERPLLAQLLTQRGRFDEALAVVRRDVEARVAGGAISAEDLRQRGNAAWRADRLADALDDLRGALDREGDPSQVQGVRADVAVLEDQVRSLQGIAARLRLVNEWTVLVGALLLVAVGFAAGIRRRRTGSR